VRQARIEALRGQTLVDEDTVLPAVALWWRTLEAERAESEIDHLGSAALATDWGTRLISDRSPLYDPLSYHYGSVWGLFTGWSAVGAYRYGRPHVGYQALMANALLTYQDATGYVTELLSGEFNAPFGRSSHHQVWSQAMVVSPVLTGLFGIETGDGGRRLAAAPQLPGGWDRAAVRNLAIGPGRYDVTLQRAADTFTLRVEPIAGATRTPALALAPALPLDARVTAVTANGRPVAWESRAQGDVQRVHVTLPPGTGPQSIVVSHTPGTEVFVRIDPPKPGAASEALRVLRVRPGEDALRLKLEGLAGRTYELAVRTPRRIEGVHGVTVAQEREGATLRVTFEGGADGYLQRELTLPLR
jgi:hypothetical protein